MKFRDIGRVRAVVAAAARTLVATGTVSALIAAVLLLVAARPALAGWSGWSQIGTGVSVEGPGVVLSPAGNEDVFVAGTDGQLYEAGRTPGSAWPTGGYSHVAPVPSGQRLVHAPSALKVSSTETDVFGTFQDGHVYVTSFRTGGSWTAWSRLGGPNDTTGFGPEAVMTPTGGKQVLIIGSSGKLFTLDHPGGGDWDPAFTLRVSAGGTLISAPAAQYANGKLDVFATGTNHRIYTVSATNGTWGTWAPIGATTDVTTYGPAVIVSGTQHEDVFVTGTDGFVYELARDVGSAWSGRFGQLSQPGASVNSTPAAIAITDTAGIDPSTVDLFAAGGSQHIYQATYTTTPPPSSCADDNSCTPTTFADAVLRGLAAPVTVANEHALATWATVEGGGGGCPGQPVGTGPWASSPGPAGNPLNTAQPEAGSVGQWNSIGIQVYGDAAGHTCWYWGIKGTLDAINNGASVYGYQRIIDTLRTPATDGRSQCIALAMAVGSTPWGTSQSLFEGAC